ncbi:MAG: helix-turn-helix domain-containing protein [Verrucomicrobia bacterium]|nr:helix-turn-helix domain-containing protein [Verrucomicrobiota bacterium]
MEMIEMSTRERKRMTLMTRVAEGLLKLRETAEMMQVSYRQAKRIRRRYLQEGDAGLVHRGRGRSSNRTRPEGERKRSIALYNKRYAGFGPLLASEHLATDHGIVVDHETLRRWLLVAGVWQSHRRREVHRAARERRPRRGDLVQIDGSEHDWFEGRGPRVVLMVMIDDATNTTLARFYPAEDTAAAYDIFERYVHLHGLPVALYPDRDSIYFCTREACLEEQLANVGPETQFARAMRELDVELIPAYSPPGQRPCRATSRPVPGPSGQRGAAAGYWHHRGGQRLFGRNIPAVASGTLHRRTARLRGWPPVAAVGHDSRFGSVLAGNSQCGKGLDRVLVQPPVADRCPARCAQPSRTSRRSRGKT